VGIKLITKELSSRVIRVKLTKDHGVRSISTLDSIGSGLAQKDNFVIGTLKKIGGAVFGGLKGFVFGALKESLRFLTFSFSKLWGLLISGVNFIYNYNWNITDDDIDKQVKQSWINFAGVLGGEVGESLGFFTCGVLPAATTFAFNEPLGLYLLERVGEEFAEELALNISIVLQQGIRSASTSAFSFYYKNIRKILKQKDSPLRKFIPQKTLDNWGKKGAPVLSFASKVEAKIDSISDPMKKAFVDNLREGLYDGCIEGGYILAGALDSWYLQQRQQAEKNRQEIIEIVPNREEDSEIIVLAGNRTELKPAITNILATHQLVQNRDVGMIAAQPIDEWLSKQRSDIMVTITYYNCAKPPIPQKDRIRAIYKISHVSRSKISFLEIKNAAGKNGYNYGRFKAEASLDKGGFIYCYAASSAEAKSQVESLAQLSSAEILRINITEETKTGKRRTNKKLQKESARIYPYCATIFVNRETAVDGKAFADGKNRKQEMYRFFLWKDNAPNDFAAQIAKLFS
jgi:hypothetical protein